MQLIHNRTIFSEQDQPRSQDSFWPPGLLTSEDKRELEAAKPQPAKLDSGKALQSFFGMK